MTTQDIKKIERLPGEIDEATTNRIVESVVIRGDISGLSPQERSRYYLQLCNSLGLNPATQPFAILKLNGKEVLYATRGATDQLAAIHRLNREIIDGPKVIDIAGTKMVYALCKATHPNGRVETAVATLPLTDPMNALMKAETKAKRRATLSILGLGMLDEMELETIQTPTHKSVSDRFLDKCERLSSTEVLDLYDRSKAYIYRQSKVEIEKINSYVANCYKTHLETKIHPKAVVNSVKKHFGVPSKANAIFWQVADDRIKELENQALKEK